MFFSLGPEAPATAKTALRQLQVPRTEELLIVVGDVKCTTTVGTVSVDFCQLFGHLLLSEMSIQVKIANAPATEAQQSTSTTISAAV